MVSKAVLVTGIVAFALSGVVFFLAAWFGKPEDSVPTESGVPEWQQDLMQKYLADSFKEDGAKNDMDQVDNKLILEVLKNLTTLPHVAGGDQDHKLAQYVKDKFLEYGLNHAEIKTYDLMLDYPDRDNPNLVQLVNSTNGVLFQSVYREQGIEAAPNFVDAYLGYSPAGTVQGDLVYVNYGTTEDFELLTKPGGEYETNVTGRLCIARYGRIFRGNKAENGAVYGCKGLIIFSDPADVAGEGQTPNDVYPNTIFLPNDGMQRGSLFLGNGDPQTPNYPSLNGVYRQEGEELEMRLPKIPSQPIGYRDAKAMLERLAGKEAPEEWKGGIEGITYKLGGQFDSECEAEGCQAKIIVHNKYNITGSPNVMGIIRGSVEPDRYVMLGNHRDAWGYGDVDPSSGTTMLLEVARVLGAKVKSGNWRPRRTIMFLSWGAEEFGLMGSREFVEDFLFKMTDRAIVYFNVDVCASGPILDTSASPTITKNIVNATKVVPFFGNSTYSTYYDFWREYLELNATQEPNVAIPGAGSDHASFLFFAGVPVIDFGFNPNTKKHPSLKHIGYPMYHTAYETFDLVNRLIDPDGKIMGTAAKIAIYLTRNFADSLVLNIDLRGYEKVMLDFKDDPVVDKLKELGVDLDSLFMSMDVFANSTKNWSAMLDDFVASNEPDPLKAKYINDQMVKLDKNFLLTNGIPEQTMFRHGIISPSKFNQYGGGSFPGIRNLLHNIDDLTGSDKEQRIDQIKRHISDVMITIYQASDSLKEVHLL